MKRLGPVLLLATLAGCVIAPLQLPASKPAPQPDCPSLPPPKAIRPDACVEEWYAKSERPACVRDWLVEITTPPKPAAKGKPK